jgi:hypothetical protein
VASPTHPGRQWMIDAFKAFWPKPVPSRVPAVLSLLADDVVDYWPRPVGTVRGARLYVKVIARRNG